MTITLGTWGFFKDNCRQSMEQVIDYAVQRGITQFDTALVYGGGKAEECLGHFADKNILVTTKIPGMVKPDHQTPLDLCYNRDWMLRCTEQSLGRLHRIDTLLLHNWSTAFENSSQLQEILYTLEELKRDGVCRRIGISLPNHFGVSPSQEVCAVCDVVMLPCNPENLWGISTAAELMEHKIQVMVRSIFLSGAAVPPTAQGRAAALRQYGVGNETVVGTTSCSHLDEVMEFALGGAENEV